MQSTRTGRATPGPRSEERRAPRMVLALLTALTAMLLTLLAAPAAAAHTEQPATDPADARVLEKPPRTVTMSFTEPVGATAEDIEVAGPSGEPLPVDVQALDSTVAVTPAAPLAAEGTHRVTWRVPSADGHPISGSFTFSIGAPATPPTGHGAPAAAHGALVAHHAAQTLVYLGIFAAAGLVVFDLLLLAAPPGTAPGSRRRVRALAGLGAAAAAAGAVASVPATVMWQSGATLIALADPGLWRTAIGSDAAVAAAMTGVGTVVAVGALPRAAGDRAAPAGRLALGGVALAVASLVVVGHSRAVAPSWLVVTADAVHVATGVVWIGGILGLLAVLGQARDLPVHQATATLVRFSTVAAGTVLALTVAGVILGWRILGDAEALVTTGYGRLLLLKVLVVAGVVGVAAWNRWRLLPRVRARSDPAARDDLRSALHTEGALLLFVLVLTGVLTSLSP
ncbi:CopD family protein [Kocuria oceani]|uniref:CopD family protein n=1 Tax=Kocuria oceani TaxID=988827 RepID=A0ABV9THD5_9MICC|nr:CopD family protein [Kocuria oceani]